MDDFNTDKCYNVLQFIRVNLPGAKRALIGGPTYLLTFNHLKISIGSGVGVLNSFCPGGEFTHQKKLPGGLALEGGWSGLELTDT